MFRFKQFNISQELCAMKVGTDGVLLGAWAEGGTKILDIGTGTGLLALMMAQRFPQSRITAIDIDHDACQQAMQNIQNSPFKNQIEVFEKSIQIYTKEVSSQNKGFDSIVCNPPYFVNSLKAPDVQRSVARHTDTLPHRQLLQCVTSLLSEDGAFTCILPTEIADEFLGEAAIIGLSTTRRTDIKTTPTKQPKRTLLELKHGFPGKTIKETAVLQTAEGKRTAWYQQLTSDFYLF